MQTVKGIYRNGQIELSEKPKEVTQARVIVTFLGSETDAATDCDSVENLGEIFDEDLATASREISETLTQALAQSARELEKHKSNG